MKITNEKKHEYWNHFVTALFVDGPKHSSITGPRLRKIKPVIWADEDFWFDILYRHDGNSQSPEQMAKLYENLYEHCRSNFWGMICQSLVERGMLK